MARPFLLYTGLAYSGSPLTFGRLRIKIPERQLNYE